MRKQNVITGLVVVLVLGFVTLGFAQFGSQSAHRELGYYDRQTGEFTPLRTADAAQDDAELARIAPTTGTLIFKYTITAKSPLPKNSVLACSGGAFVSESSGFSSTERATGIATLVSGTTYTCTSTINYSWLLSSPSTDKIQFQNIHASSSYGYQVTATNGTAILVQPVGGRESDQSPLAPISVPANGATTTENVSIML